MESIFKELLLENVVLDESDTNTNSFEQLESQKHLIEDDQLRLIFYCCHPLLPLDSQIALSLRDVCSMTTAEIARAYLVSVETIKKRISRAKAQIKQKISPMRFRQRRS